MILAGPYDELYLFSSLDNGKNVKLVNIPEPFDHSPLIAISSDKTRHFVASYLPNVHVMEVSGAGGKTSYKKLFNKTFPMHFPVNYVSKDKMLLGFKSYFYASFEDLKTQNFG